MGALTFRQVHLDFHTSEIIKNIGSRFTKQQFQEMLQLGCVDCITLFSKCHHGWAYHPSKANEMHPELSFDLLGSMIQAAHEIGVKTPVYISAGLDEKLARRHPEWLMRYIDDTIAWTANFMQPGYHLFCFNTPYLDILLSQVEEVVRNYDADGIFLDIVGIRPCYCQNCIRALLSEGKDPKNYQNILDLGERVYANYTNRIQETIHRIKPGMRIFHNSSHVKRGRRDLANMNTHLELESLPTGGWGYDHFPLSARYVQNLGMDYLGMTGKFHSSWGEFGGYKHPNALRYETALSIANGARCSIGDQLHPNGCMDEATYSLISSAYKEVQEKEPWCVGVNNIADIALLSLEATCTKEQEESGIKSVKSDIGAVRILLEGKFLFDVIDDQEDFNKYKVVILADHIMINRRLKTKLESYFLCGGKVFATGESGLNEAGDAFGINLGVIWIERNAYRPDYFKPTFKPGSLWNTSYVFYSEGQKVELKEGVELGIRENPYFNRDTFSFCSHQHTPNSMEYGGPGMVESEQGIYFAWNVFEEYAEKGSLILKEAVVYALNRLLSHKKTLNVNLPAQGVVTLMEQMSQNRYINHLLYAVPVKRGEGVEIIEDIVPVYNINVSLQITKKIKRVYLAPQMEDIPFQHEGAKLTYTVPIIDCHQMICLDY